MHVCVFNLYIRNYYTQYIHTYYVNKLLFCKDWSNSTMESNSTNFSALMQIKINLPKKHSTPVYEHSVEYLPAEW